MLETQCQEFASLIRFIFMVAEWFTFNITEQTVTFSTGQGIFSWSAVEPGLFCFNGEAT